MLSWIICPRISLSGCGRANAGPVKSKRERTFRERAYLLGQEAGCPDNQADGFRHRACEIERKSTDWTLLHATGQLPPIRALREGDVLVIWKLDRLGRTLAHLVNTVQSFQTTQRIEGTDRHDDVRGRMIFGIFMTPAEFERDLLRALTEAKVRLAQAAMVQRDISVAGLCSELAIQRVTLYRYVGPDGLLRSYGRKVLGLTQDSASSRKRPLIAPILNMARFYGEFEPWMTQQS
jgi:hypothetical protein